MTKYIIRRILIAIPMLLAISIMTFAFINLAPGDPVDAMIDPEFFVGGAGALAEAPSLRFFLVSLGFRGLGCREKGLEGLYGVMVGLNVLEFQGDFRVWVL